MPTPDIFQSRAAECEAMAKIAREQESKVIWTRLAERWRLCADLEVWAVLTAAQRSCDRHRKTPPGWSRH